MKVIIVAVFLISLAVAHLDFDENDLYNHKLAPIHRMKKQTEPAETSVQESNSQPLEAAQTINTFGSDVAEGAGEVARKLKRRGARISRNTLEIANSSVVPESEVKPADSANTQTVEALSVRLSRDTVESNDDPKPVEQTLESNTSLSTRIDNITNALPELPNLLAVETADARSIRDAIDGDNVAEPKAGLLLESANVTFPANAAETQNNDNGVRIDQISQEVVAQPEVANPVAEANAVVADERSVIEPAQEFLARPVRQVAEIERQPESTQLLPNEAPSQIEAVNEEQKEGVQNIQVSRQIAEEEAPTEFDDSHTKDHGTLDHHLIFNRRTSTY